MAGVPTLMGLWSWPWIWSDSYRRVSLIDLYLHAKFPWNRRNFLWTNGNTYARTHVCMYIRMHGWTFETGFIRSTLMSRPKNWPITHNKPVPINLATCFWSVSTRALMNSANARSGFLIRVSSSSSTCSSICVLSLIRDTSRAFITFRLCSRLSTSSGFMFATILALFVDSCSLCLSDMSSSSVRQIATDC